MMTRQTSIEAYNAIKENGLLGNLQFQVYDAIYNYGPSTQQEICVSRFPDTQARNIMPRFAELARMGVISCVGTRPCQITKRECMVWEITGNLPVKQEKKKTKDQIIRDLREENTILKRRLNGELF
jgi:hypothetical protein